MGQAKEKYVEDCVALFSLFEVENNAINLRELALETVASRLTGNSGHLLTTSRRSVINNPINVTVNAWKHQQHNPIGKLLLR